MSHTDLKGAAWNLIKHILSRIVYGRRFLEAPQSRLSRTGKTKRIKPRGSWLRIFAQYAV